jgi:RimJ/RimL family protein N-acetyltransferase
MTSRSLKETLPKRLRTDRLVLEIFDHSDAHYDCFFEAMNSKTAHATMGDYGIRTRSQFNNLAHATRLFPQASGNIDKVDTDIVYVSRLKGEEEDKPHQPLPQPLVGVVTLCQRSEAAPPDLGWSVREAYMHKGYAAEAARELLCMCQDVLGIKEIIAWPGENNRASIRTAQKVGFVDGGINLDQEGPRHCIYVLPGMKLDPGLVLSFWGRGEEGGSE